MKKALVLIALFASLSAAPTAFACSPAPSWPPTASENVAQKDIAFIGTVKSIIQDKSVNGEYRITFTVNEVYKGDLESTVTVQTRSSSAACGFDDGYKTFEKGTVWAIYGTGSSSEGYATDSLSLNTKYTSVSAAEKALEKLGVTKDSGPIACTMQYAPVCGKTKDGVTKTFGNSCTLGAEKAEFLYEGECTVATKAPTTDLWLGMRGADVTWLQDYLIKTSIGTAAQTLGSMGATGYFGTLTKAALAEFQKEHGILPAQGYFGAKTRAFIESKNTPAPTSVFKGTIDAVSTACFADGICSVTVDGKEVILLAGLRVNVPPVGSLLGVDSIGDLEKEIGSKAEVYAAETEEGDAEYTLYGSTEYYVKVVK